MVTPPESNRRAPSREALLAVHEFPGSFVIKAFGPGPALSDFNERAVACAHAVLSVELVTVRQRPTRSGRRVCVTLEMQVERVEDVEAVYERLFRLSDLRLIL